MLRSAIYITWIIFWILWISAAFSAKGSKTYRTGRQIYIRLIILVAVLILVGVTKNNVTLSLGHELWAKVLGTIMFISGLLLAIWARFHLGKNWGMPMSIRNEPELVTSGPYRLIRHPIYSGILLAAIGTALAISYWWLAIFVISGSYFIYSSFVEEKDMEKQFTSKYQEYKKKSKMLIPYIF